MTQKRELEIYRNLLINLHEANWTGNKEQVQKIMKAIGNYSYVRTNSNGFEKEENKIKIQTLIDLENI
jgi:hypothetical protein